MSHLRISALRSMSMGVAVLLSAMCVASARTARAQQTWVVDAASGPGTFSTEIQPAVDAASAGDLVLVRSGSYDSFVLAKGLRVAADRNASVAIVDLLSGNEGSIMISNVPAGERAEVHGLWGAGTLDWVVVDRCAGDVVLSDLMTTGRPTAIRDSSNVSLHRCNTLVAIQRTARVVLHLCGPGGSYTPAPGLSVDSGSSVYASRTYFAGIHEGSRGTIWLLGGCVIREWCYTTPPPNCYTTAPNATFHAAADTIVVTTTLPATTMHLAAQPFLMVNSPAAIGSTVTFDVTGDAGATAAVLLSRQWITFPIPLIETPLLIGPALVATAGFVLDGTGSGSVALRAPNDPLLRHRSWFAIPATLDGGTSTLELGGVAAVEFN